MYLLIKSRKLRIRKVKPLLEKMGLPVKLDRGMAVATVGSRYGVRKSLKTGCREALWSVHHQRRMYRDLFLEKMCIVGR
jgi:hypothetical protein